jgi:DNA-binding NarL/FixJ family response regulator
VKPIKLLLVDDQELFLESLRTVIERSTEDLEVSGVARNGAEAVEAARELEPDLVIMDVRMPVMDGVEATKAIMDARPEARIMMLTTFGDDEYVKEALERGAAGYVLKDVPPSEIIAAIRAVAGGAFLVAPSVARSLIGKAYGKEGPESEDEPEWIAKLSRRELEILERLSAGLSNKEIAAQLFIAEPTVRNHVSAIYDKMGAANRAEAARMAKRGSTKS